MIAYRNKIGNFHKGLPHDTSSARFQVGAVLRENP